MTPIVDGLIDRAMKRYRGPSYYSDVHQLLAPLARDMEMTMRKHGLTHALWEIEQRAKDIESMP